MTDVAAVAQARAGDCDAFRLLVDRHSRKVFRLAYRLTGNETDAEDVVQESFMRAYRSLSTFDERAIFSSWLYRIATNCALDMLRLRKVRNVQPLEGRSDEQGDYDRFAATAPGPERLAISSELQTRIAAAMELLTPQERVAFTLRHFEGQTIDEISWTLEVSVNATKHAVFRAVQKMRQALETVEG